MDVRRNKRNGTSFDVELKKNSDYEFLLMDSESKCLIETMNFYWWIPNQMDLRYTKDLKVKIVKILISLLKIRLEWVS